MSVNGESETIEESPTAEDRKQSSKCDLFDVVAQITVPVIDPPVSTTASADPRTQATNEEKMDPNSMTKSQLKRKRRLEHLTEKKRLKKERDREVKKKKAEAEGRSLEEERRHNEEHFGKGKYGEMRRKKLEEKLKMAELSFQICVDCGYESHMTAKEINSLASQLRYCYSNNKRSETPCLLTVTGLSESSQTFQHLSNVSGFDTWNPKAFHRTEQSLQDHFANQLDRIVYLTSDSPTTLQDLDNSKIYVIGGIVDRNRYKGAAFQRAQSIPVATAKLPIDEHLSQIESSRVLTTNHVFEMLLKYKENGKDWKRALADVLPGRKRITIVKDQETETTPA